MTRPSIKLHKLFASLYHVEVPQQLAPIYTVGLVITVYNRPGYLKRTLQSLRRKRTLGGAHLFFHVNALVEVAYAGTNLLTTRKSDTWDWVLADYLINCDYRFYAVRPSVTQHIGKDGINSKTFFYYDFAVDYYFPQPDIGNVLWLLLRASRTMFGIAFISVRRVKSMWFNK